jgi:predicted GNAT family acetyltransferase
VSTPGSAVVDDVTGHRFRYVEDGVEAELVYRTRGDRLVLVHTLVPDALGGRGVGGQLVRAAVARAARTGETVVPSCPFARKWLQDHSDAASTIAIDWREEPA